MASYLKNVGAKCHSLRGEDALYQYGLEPVGTFLNVGFDSIDSTNFKKKKKKKRDFLGGIPQRACVGVAGADPDLGLSR